VAERDWWQWHERYDDPSSELSQRLSVVQHRLAQELDRCPAGTVYLTSMCAGQAKDVVGALSGHPRRDDVKATLVELDERNVDIARSSIAAAGLPGVDVVQADAGGTDAYAGTAPAYLLLACGVFGNITDADIACTISALPTLCAANAYVIWTRHRRPPDLTPSINTWFEAAGFKPEAYDGPEGTLFGVGAHRFVGEPRGLEPGQKLFTFVGSDALS
jgi:hypothetical protein